MSNEINKYCRFWLLVALAIIAIGLVITNRCFGQDRPPDIRITDFGGQNTKSSIFGMGPNEARRSLNVDPSLLPPALRKRKGYVAMTDTLPGTTPVYGLWPFTFRDGVKRLFAVTDQRGADTSLTGLGHLVVSDAFGYSIDFSGDADSLFAPVYTGVTPTFTGAKGDVIISFDGRQRPLKVTQHGNSLVARNLVPPAPGEPLIVPMNDSASTSWGNLDGEYRYLVKGQTVCGVGDSAIAIDDPGFETWTDTNNLTNWVFDDDGSTVTLEKDSVEELGGVWCAKISGPQDSTGKLSDAIYDLETTTNYTASYYVKTSSGASYARLVVTSLFDSTVIYTASWRPLSVNWFVNPHSFTTIASDSIGVSLEFYSSSGAMVAYVDSLVINSNEEILYNSYLSQPMSAYDEKVYLGNFLFHTITPSCAEGAADWDDISLSIFRCRANSADINDLDTFWRVSNFTNLTAANLDTLRFIDSIPDDSLGQTGYTTWELFDDTKRGREADLSLSGFRVGALTYGGRNTEDDTSNVCFISLPYYKINDTGIQIIDSTLQYVAYGMTYFDSITNAESDMGRLLYIFCNDSTGDSNITVGTPPLPSGVGHLTRVLYKMVATMYPRDTSWGNIVLRYDTNEVWTQVAIQEPHGTEHWIPGGQYMWENADKKRFSSINCMENTWYGSKAGYCKVYWVMNYAEVPVYSLDTNESQFYPVAYIRDSSVKQFIDTTDWTLISQQMPFASSVTPVNLGQIVWIFDRAFGINGADVYWSKLDSGSHWSPLTNMALRLDDGSNITKIKEFRDHIKIFKTNDQFLIYEGTGGEYSRKWVINGIGCIASRSMADYNNGLVYLSGEGVLYETGLIYKDKGSSFELISLPIQDIIDAWTPDELRTAVGVIHDNKYMMSIPAKDTTLVYNFISKKWTIYDFSFSQAAFYDTIAGIIRPAKDFLFIKADDDRIFKGDTLGTDTGANRAIYWKSGPLAISPMKKGIDRIGFYVEPNDIDSAFGLIIYNDQNIAVDSFSITPASVYHEISIPVGLEVGNFFYIEVYQQGGASVSSLADINGIDIWLYDGYKEYTD